MDPYAHQTETVQSGQDLFGNYRLIPSKKKQSERGLLLQYFSQKTGYAIPRIAQKLQGIPTQDLYFVKSSCDQYEQGGNPWGKAFNGMLKK